MSNTSKDRGKKGSKFWMQTLVSLHNGIELTKEIQMRDNTVGDIKYPIIFIDAVHFSVRDNHVIKRSCHYMLFLKLIKMGEKKF